MRNDLRKEGVLDGAGADADADADAMMSKHDRSRGTLQLRNSELGALNTLKIDSRQSVASQIDSRHSVGVANTSAIGIDAHGSGSVKSKKDKTKRNTMSDLSSLRAQAQQDAEV